MRYMLDTDVASLFLKGRAPAVEARLEALPPERVCVSVMTCAELLYGLERLPPEHRLHVVVRRFLDLVPVLPWTVRAAEWYARIRHRLAAAGAPIGEMDTMIAAHAIAEGAVLVTGSGRHFGRVGAPLTTETW